MRTIAIINQKGGVGKTTTTANLGAAFARAGQNVLLIDLDPQGHLSLHFGVEIAPDQSTIYDVLTSGTPAREVLVQPRERIALMPADVDLAAAEAELISVTGREVLLREAIASLDRAYDVVVIDCPPSLGVLTINALAASTEVMIPLQAHFFGLQGLSKLLDTVMLVRQRINPALCISGIALCMHEAATKLASEVAADIGKFLEAARGSDKPWAKAQLYKTAIRRNIKLAESSSFGQTVFDYAPKSNGAVDYANLAAEIMPGLDLGKLIESSAGTEDRPADAIDRHAGPPEKETQQPVMVGGKQLAKLAAADRTRQSPASVNPVPSGDRAAPPSIVPAPPVRIGKSSTACTELDIRRPAIAGVVDRVDTHALASPRKDVKIPVPRTPTKSGPAPSSRSSKTEQPPNAPPRRVPPVTGPAKATAAPVAAPAAPSEPLPSPATVDIDRSPVAAAAC